MEEFDAPDPDFVKGFNEGYMLAKHLPDLAEQLGTTTGDTPRGSGIQAGRRQLFLEQEQERYPTWLRGDYANRADAIPDKTPEKDKDVDLDR